REREHLLLAAAQRSRLLVASLFEPGEILERAPEVVLDGRSVAARVGAHAHVLPDREVLEDPSALGHVRDAVARDTLGRPGGDPAAGERDLAVLAHEPRDCAERRRLAGAVRA